MKYSIEYEMFQMRYRVLTLASPSNDLQNYAIERYVCKVCIKIPTQTSWMQGSTDDRWSTHIYLPPLKTDPHLYGNSFYNKCGTSNQWKNMEYPMSRKLPGSLANTLLRILLVYSCKISLSFSFLVLGIMWLGYQGYYKTHYVS